MISEWLPLETINQSFIHLLRLANSWQGHRNSMRHWHQLLRVRNSAPPPPHMRDRPPHQGVRHLLFANMVWVL